MDLASDHERIPQVDPVRVHNGSCAGSPAGSVRASDRARTGPAGTCVSVDLCSTPYKVLRFAPTPLAPPGARGLRTLTASARSSRTWLLRAGHGLRTGLVRPSREADT